MNERQDLFNGALLHDVGKICHRHLDHRNHSVTGYEFLKNDIKLPNKNVLTQVHYHHAKLLKGAKLPSNSLAYITYFADNISAGIDRREQEDRFGFDRQSPLDSVFNILNGNDEKAVYGKKTFGEEETILYPTSEHKVLDETYYGQILKKLREHLSKDIDNEAFNNSTLQLLESIWSYVPSSTSNAERRDISLFDHSKLTAALAIALYDYLTDNHLTDFKELLYKKTDQVTNSQTFLLVSMDMSGIQDFIYTITSKGALKGLRTRSFYLDLLMEYANDTLLDRVRLTRANLLYSGGGHAYLLMANTEETKNALSKFKDGFNQWLMDIYDISLYLAIGYVPCTSNDLKNIPKGSYEEMFRRLSNELSQSKAHRYAIEDLNELNQRAPLDHDRECVICHRTDGLDENNRCSICQRIEQMSVPIMNECFFGVVSDEDEREGLPLAFGKKLVPLTEQEIKEALLEEKSLRVYSKNKRYMGQSLETALWVGDYQSSNSFTELADGAQGIRRLAVFRADVDDMGQSFVSGFKRGDDDTFVTLSRTSMFSRLMLEYFKKHINTLLQYGRFHLDGTTTVRPRIASVVYAGGDDLFIVGAWQDIIGFSVDLYQSFKKYSAGSLHFSAGIGLFPEKYPIASMADETGRLEEAAKLNPGKNSVAIFDVQESGHVYTWQVFIENVINEKLQLLRDYFSKDSSDISQENTALLYKLHNMVTKRGETINIARLAYLLGRLRPPKEATQKDVDRYETFSKRVFSYLRNDSDAEEFVLAILLYVYLNRKENSHE